MLMTNDEAITIIKKEFSEYRDTLSVYAKKRKKAFTMAIKALEQQPCEDAVSRTDVLDLTLMKMGGKELYVAVYDLPPVTPQPKRGKWIEVEVHNCHATLKCSVCDRTIEPTFTFGEYSYEDIKEFYPYCHCGADMRGSESE